MIVTIIWNITHLSYLTLSNVLALSSVSPTENACKSQTYHQYKHVYHQGKHLYEKCVIIFDRRQLYQNCINITVSGFSIESVTGSCLLMIICIIATCLPSSESTYQPRLWITIRNFVNVREVKFVSNLWERMTKCNSMPLVRLGLTICVVKSSYFLMRHGICKIMLLFCLGGSRPSLKVHEVKCIPGDPATTCPVLFKGSHSPLLLALRCVTYCTFHPYLVRRCLVLC